MAPVYLPQPYPVLPVEYAPNAVPMPVIEMSPQPVMMMPMQQMGGSAPPMTPFGMQPPMQYQYGM